MTIEAWNIVLSAAILGLLTGGGIWLKYVVDQQLKAKDTAIGALEAVVKVKEAQIASLKDDTAPAITKAYADMRKHADLITEDSQRLSKQLSALTEKQQRDELIAPARNALGKATGLSLASDILDKHVAPIFRSPEKPSVDLFFERYMRAYEEITQSIGTRIATAQAALAGTPRKQLGPSAE